MISVPDDPMRTAPPHQAPGEREPREISEAEREAAIAELIDQALTIRPARSIHASDGRNLVYEALTDGLEDITPAQLHELTDAVRGHDDATAGRVVRALIYQFVRRVVEPRVDEYIANRE